MRSIVYIDGFNLYYGALKGTPYKWLNLHALCCRILQSHNTLVQIKYFTARVKDRSGHSGQALRQQMYFRALATEPLITTIYGSFLSNVVRMPLAAPVPGGPRTVEVLKTEEKGSDVNIASHLVFDACQGACNLTVVLSNDSDLAEPVRILRQELGLAVGILYPSVGASGKASRSLAQHATFIRPIAARALAASQFPSVMADAVGDFYKPHKWDLPPY